MSKDVTESTESAEREINVLDDVLNTLRFRGNIFFRSKLAAPWGVEFDEMKTPRFHISLKGDFFIGKGQCKNEKINVKHMDIVMVPHGDMHWIADQPHSHIRPSMDANIACQLGSPLFQNGIITNKMLCGIVHYEEDILHPIISSLPSVLHFSELTASDPIWMTILLIDKEMGDEYSGKTTIIDRLTEVLFLQLLNKYIADNKELIGFFAALKNKRIHSILKLIHQKPEHQWTLDELIEISCMSRSTLLRQFKSMLGMTPINYVKNWRMTKAYFLLKYTNKSLEQIADNIGFSSARTMNKSFKSHFKLTPNELRKLQAG